MDEAVQLALNHERELRENLEEDLEARLSTLEKSVTSQTSGIKAEIKSLKNWDRFKMIGFILVGLWLSSMPEYVSVLKTLMK